MIFLFPLHNMIFFPNRLDKLHNPVLLVTSPGSWRSDKDVATAGWSEHCTVPGGLSSD